MTNILDDILNNFRKATGNQGSEIFGGKLIKPIPERDFQDNNNQTLQQYYNRQWQADNLPQTKSTFQPKTVQYANSIANNNGKSNPALFQQLYDKAFGTNSNVPLKVSPVKELPIQQVKIKQAPVAKARELQITQPATANYAQFPEFKDFKTAPIPNNLQGLIYNSAKQAGINPAILASVLFSEHGFQVDQNKTYNRDVNGNIIPNNYDRGVAQINTLVHPDITDEQAFDPNFAIPYAANLLASHIKSLGNINRGIAAYNVGRGGATVNGPTPSGLGPRGSQYLGKVAAGLSPALRANLGIVYNE